MQRDKTAAVQRVIFTGVSATLQGTGPKYLQVFQKWEVLKGIRIYVIQVSKISNFTVKKGGMLIINI